jgi:membrane protein required for colicin V production
MNGFDIVVLALLVGGALIGLARGAMRIVIGIASLLVAFFLANRYQDQFASVLMQRHVSATPARIAAYLLIFVLTMIAGGLVAWLVAKLLKLAMLSWADRLAGAALGLVFALLAAAFLVHPLAASTPGGSRLLAGSKLAPYVSVVADVGNAAAPDAVAKRYDEGMGTLRKIWSGQQPLPDTGEVKKAIEKAVDAGKSAVKKTAKDSTEAPPPPTGEKR